MSFTTLAAAKVQLGIDSGDTTHDAFLQPIVDGVNDELLNLFSLTSTTSTQYTYKYDIWDRYTEDIWVRSYPVTSIDSVTFDGTALDTDEYYLKRPFRNGLLSLTKRTFPVGRQLVEVTHTAGWAGGTVDAELQNAAVLMVVVRFNMDRKLGYNGERIGQYFYELGGGRAAGIGASGGISEAGMPIASRRILDRWIRPFVTDE